MKNKTIRTSIIIAAIIIIGIILTVIYRTNIDASNMPYKQIDISIGKEFNNEDILNIVKEVVGDRKVKVQKVGIYQDGVAINIKEISSEELESLNTKINEKYELENTVDSIDVTDMPKVSIMDYAKPYIKPLVIACVIIAVYVAVYFVISRRKN